MGWLVMNWVNRHNCAGEARDNESRFIHAEDIAQLVMDKIRADPSYAIHNIQIDCHTAFKCEVDY